MRHALFRLAVLSMLQLDAGCLLEDPAPPRPLTSERLVAVVPNPPEALPGEAVQYRALVASADGPVETAPARWSYCRSPRPLSENGAVSVACATYAELPLADTGLEIMASLPKDACARFGSETSAGLRPNDPDLTGGYYQPLRVSLAADQTVILRHRVRCALANAPIDVTQAFERRYHTNQAPVIETLESPEALDDALAAAHEVELRVTVQDGSREQYVVYDERDGTLKERSEALQVSWLVSRGTLEVSAASIEGDYATTRWTTPERSGSAWAWAVVVDDRGGVASAVHEFHIDAAR